MMSRHSHPYFFSITVLSEINKLTKYWPTVLKKWVAQNLVLNVQIYEFMQLFTHFYSFDSVFFFS